MVLSEDTVTVLRSELDLMLLLMGIQTIVLAIFLILAYLNFDSTGVWEINNALVR